MARQTRGHTTRRGRPLAGGEVAWNGDTVRPGEGGLIDGRETGVARNGHLYAISDKVPLYRLFNSVTLLREGSTWLRRFVSPFRDQIATSGPNLIARLGWPSPLFPRCAFLLQRCLLGLPTV